ncbi:hypothetical protein ACOSP7_006661 [Xanthoceras sorbifolium]
MKQLKYMGDEYNHMGNDGNSNTNGDEDGDPHDIHLYDMHDLIKEVCPQDPNADAQNFYDLLAESEQPLYPNCEKYSNLSFVVKLMHIKCINGWSNKSFIMLLEFLKDAFPMCDKLPTSNYDTKKMVRDLGLHYVKIDACKNDCILYYKEYAKASECPICELPRWMQTRKVGNDKAKKVPWKVLRYFPITPRLQRLFMSSKTAVDMRWHFENRIKDGLLRHSADRDP